MREEVRDLKGWMEWGQNQGTPIPGIAAALGQIHAKAPVLAKPALNMIAVMSKARNAIAQMQENWDEGSLFNFHLLGNHSLFLRPKETDERLKKGRVTIREMAEVQASLKRQFAEQDQCIEALGLPSEKDKLPDALLRVYGDEKAVNAAVLTLSIMVGARLMMEELLALLQQPAFLALPNVEGVATTPMTINLLEAHDPTPEGLVGLEGLI